MHTCTILTKATLGTDPGKVKHPTSSMWHIYSRISKNSSPQLNKLLGLPLQTTSSATVMVPPHGRLLNRAKQQVSRREHMDPVRRMKLLARPMNLLAIRASGDLFFSIMAIRCPWMI